MLLAMKTRYVIGAFDPSIVSQIVSCLVVLS